MFAQKTLFLGPSPTPCKMTRISRVGAGKKGKQQFCLGMGVGEQLGKGEMSAEKRDATAQKNGMQLIDGEWGGN